MNKTAVRLGLLVLTMAVAACSHMSRRHHTDFGADAGNGVQTYGVGDPRRFINPKFGFIDGQPSKQIYYFAFDSNQVNEQYYDNIAAQAYYLKSHPNARVRIEGNTDERGSREYNIGLGERRAVAVKDMLLANGASRNQINVISYGQEKPVALGHDEAAYRLNRRDDLVWLRN